MPRSTAGAVVSVDRFFELSLLGLVASGYLAVLGSGYLDIPTAALTAAGLLLRALMVTGIVRLRPSTRLIGALTVAYIGFYPIDYAFVSGEFLPATVHLVFFLAVIKILTAHATRDYVFVGIIAFLELLAASVLSTNLNFFVFLALFMLFGVATFASAEIRRSMRKPGHLVRNGLKWFHWRLAALTLSVAIGILLLTAGMFFILPRTAQAAFQHLVPQRYRIPGFSNEMTLGEIGEIQKRTSAVLHVRIDGASHPEQLKWRGIALAEFDGRRWYNPADAGKIMRVNRGLVQLADNPQQWRKGERIKYEVQLSALASDALFFAGRPEFVRIDLPLIIATSTDGYRVGISPSEGVHYGAYSFIEETAPPPEPPAHLSSALRLRYLQLPRLDPRIAALTRQITGGAPSEEASARLIESHLQHKYGYTTQLLSQEVSDPLAHFLFERRKGHCEYFASAMAVMLRTLGIPARVVNGFQNGIFNPVSGWYVIRAADAHSWVEAWLPRRGWTTFDPTPPDLNPPALSVWTKLGFYIDAAETFWREWVLNYNLDRQLILASRMENSSRSFSTQWLDNAREAAQRWKNGAIAWSRRYGAAILAMVALSLALLLFGPRLWRWWKALERVRQVQRGAARASDATLLYGRMLELLKRRGFEKPAWFTPNEFAGVLPVSETASLVSRFTAAYNDVRFGRNPDAAPRMLELLEQMQRL